jgi:hypothetical protein
MPGSRVERAGPDPAVPAPRAIRGRGVSSSAAGLVARRRRRPWPVMVNDQPLIWSLPVFCRFICTVPSPS